MKALKLTLVAAALALMVGLTGMSSTSAAKEVDPLWGPRYDRGYYGYNRGYRNYGYRHNRHGYRYRYGHNRRYNRRHGYRYRHRGPSIYFRAPGFGFHFGY
jgi:hypothetical protein